MTIPKVLKIKSDKSSFSQMTRHEEIGSKAPQTLAAQGFLKGVTSGNVALVSKSPEACRVGEKIQSEKTHTEVIPGSTSPLEPTLGCSPTVEGSASLGNVIPFPGNVSPKVDLSGLTKMELRKRFTAEANSHKNMLSRVEKCGATVHPAFRDFASFLAHVGPIPAKGATLDRIDNTDPEYGPGKVRWADKKTQNNNKGDTATFFDSRTGETFTTSRLAKVLKVPATNIRKQRERGWTDAEIIEGQRANKVEAKPEPVAKPKTSIRSKPAAQPKRIRLESELSANEVTWHRNAACCAHHREEYGVEYFLPTYEEEIAFFADWPSDAAPIILPTREQYMRHVAKWWASYKEHILFDKLPQQYQAMVEEIDPNYVAKQRAKADAKQSLEKLL